MTERLVNSLVTPGGTPDCVLDGAHNNSVTTITVDAVPAHVVAGNSRLRIDDEIILFTGVTGTTFTGCTRAAENAAQLPAAAHSDGAGVYIVPTAGGLAQYVSENGSQVKLAETVLGSPAANIDFTSISGAYKHLRIVWQARGTTAAATTPVSLRFNADSGANYDWMRSLLQDAFDAFAATSGQCGIVVAASLASYPGGGEILIHNYAAAVFYKSFTAQSVAASAISVGGILASQHAGYWRSTAPITRITILPTAGNFATGSVFSLYGLV